MGRVPLWTSSTPASVYSSIDEAGRYSYRNQPVIAEWNLARLAESLLPLFHDVPEDAVALAQESLAAFRGQYSEAWSAGMRAKIGLSAGSSTTTVAPPLADRGAEPPSRSGRADHTSFFRSLGAAARGDTGPVRSLLPDPSSRSMRGPTRWQAQRPPTPTAMDRVNPAYIPRNHLVEEALAGRHGRRPGSARTSPGRGGQAPYEERPGLGRYADPAPVEDFGAYRTFCGT